MDDLSIFVGYGLLWGRELHNLIGDAGMIFLIGPLLGLWWHYTFHSAVDKKAVAKKIKKSLEDGDYEKVDIGL